MSHTIAWFYGSGTLRFNLKGSNMKRPGGLVTVTLLLSVFALLEIRAAIAQVQRRTLNYTDGSRYEGEILNGKRHGRGTYSGFRMSIWDACNRQISPDYPMP